MGAGLRFEGCGQRSRVAERYPQTDCAPVFGFHDGHGRIAAVVQSAVTSNTTPHAVAVGRMAGCRRHMESTVPKPSFSLLPGRHSVRYSGLATVGCSGTRSVRSQGNAGLSGSFRSSRGDYRGHAAQTGTPARRHTNRNAHYAANPHGAGAIQELSRRSRGIPAWRPRDAAPQHPHRYRQPARHRGRRSHSLSYFCRGCGKPADRLHPADDVRGGRPYRLNKSKYVVGGGPQKPGSRFCGIGCSRRYASENSEYDIWSAAGRRPVLAVPACCGIGDRIRSRGGQSARLFRSASRREIRVSSRLSSKRVRPARQSDSGICPAEQSGWSPS